MRCLFPLAALAFSVAAAQPGEPRYGPKQRFEGVLETAFEVSAFQGCWFETSPRAGRDWQRIAPISGAEAQLELARYRLEFVGRRTVGDRAPPDGYGHLGMWPCQIRAERMISVELLPVQSGLTPAEEQALDEAAEAVEAAAAALDAVSDAALVEEVRAFMAAYAEDLRSGNRAALAARYDRRGAFFLGDGTKRFREWAEIEERYRTRWSPPASFEWRDLSFEPVGPDSVLVAGTFLWGVGKGRPAALLSYTGLLVRQDGELRIRLEDESEGAPPPQP